MTGWTPASDAELVRAGLGGEPTPRARLVERLMLVPRVLREINGRRGRRLSEQDVEDLAQEVLISVWKKLPQFRGPATLDGWLVRFCQLEYMNYSRSHERRRRRGERLVQEAETATPDARPETDERVEIALARLSEAQRRVVMMRHENGMTFEAIAAELAESIEAVRARYYRSLRSMREFLTAGQEPGEAS